MEIELDIELNVTNVNGTIAQLLSEALVAE